MPIPCAPEGEKFSYYFQYAIFINTGSEIGVFLDSYRMEPEHPVFMSDGQICIHKEDLRHIYAPAPVPEGQAGPDGYVPISVMEALGKRISVFGNIVTLSVDAPEESNPYASFRLRLPLIHLMNGKDRGEMNYALWYEPANRMIPYRMYIPFRYDPAVPMRTLVCFHGGDANADYMFRHTNGEIERYAERRGVILLALCSYRKYTFFGASRFPAGAESADMTLENPLGLTQEEWDTSIVAEKSVMVQIGDARSRWNLDMDHLYALGNSGGSLGIFRQVQAIGRPFFRKVICSGGVGSPLGIDFELVRSTGTKFMILMSSEDHFDGQWSGRVAYPLFREKGMDVTLTVVGGGAHLTGWADALPEIFDFIEEK